MVIFLARSFSVEVPDMYTQTTIAIVLAAILFVAYLQVSGFYASRDSFKSRNMIPEMPEEAVAPPILVPPPMPVPVMKQRLDEPQNSDPYDDTRGDSDIKDNLYSIHRNAYETAYSDDVYEDIWGAFDEIFEGKPIYKTIQHPRAQNKEVEQLNLKLVDFKSKIEDFLEQYKGYNSGTLEYRGYYTAILNELEDCVAVYGPEYAGWTKTKKNINEYFLDWWEY
jgi:hypothetical protein